MSLSSRGSVSIGGTPPYLAEVTRRDAEWFEAYAVVRQPAFGPPLFGVGDEGHDQELPLSVAGYRLARDRVGEAVEYRGAGGGFTLVVGGTDVERYRPTGQLGTLEIVR